MYYNMAIDGAGLAVVADSFGALEQRISAEGALTFEEVKNAASADFAGEEGERVRRLLDSSGRYGAGGTAAG